VAKADKNELMGFRIGIAKDGSRVFLQFTNQDTGAAIEVEFSFQAAKFFCGQLGEVIINTEKKLSGKREENLFRNLCWN